MSEYITVQTNPATDIQTNQMTLNGEVTILDTSLFDIVVCYFFYSTSVDGEGNLVDPIRIPDSGDTGLFDVGAFSSILDGLPLETQYHFQAEGRTIAYLDSDALDYLTDSEGGMDSVLADITQKTKILSSPHIMDAIWSKEMASEIFWKAGSPPPPRTLIVAEDSAEITLPVEDGRTVLHFDCSSDTGSGYEELAYWEIDIDLTDVNTLKIKTKADGLGGGSSELIIWIGGTEVFSTGSEHGWIERTFDVSSYSGTTTLGLGGNVTGEYGSDIHTWADLLLEQ